jgi:hypothetical protein
MEASLQPHLRRFQRSRNARFLTGGALIAGGALGFASTLFLPSAQIFPKPVVVGAGAGSLLGSGFMMTGSAIRPEIKRYLSSPKAPRISFYANDRTGGITFSTRF